MERESKTSSNSSQDQMNFYSAIDLSREMRHSSNDDISITQLDNDQFRRPASEISPQYFQNILPSFGFGTEEFCQRYTFEPKELVSKKNRSLLTGPIQKQHSITFICFQSRQVTLWQSDIHQFISKKKASQYEVLIQCWQIIEQVIKRLCINEYQFEPMRIRAETFKLQANLDKADQYQVINLEPIDTLLTFSQVWLSRVDRNSQDNGPITEYMKNTKDEEVLQILSPDYQDIVECIDRNKTIAHLKSQISSNYYQIVGEMILITYSDFKIISNAIKIADLPEKVIQIYQKQIKYIDPAFIKQQSFNLETKKKKYQIVKEETHNGDMEEIQVNWTSVYGELKLKIKENQLIQKYSGGIVGYFKGERKKVLPLITLTGVKISGLTLNLSFQQKQGEEVYSYSFSEEESMKQVLTNILTITRHYNHHIESLT